MNKDNIGPLFFHSCTQDPNNNPGSAYKDQLRLLLMFLQKRCKQQGQKLPPQLETESAEIALEIENEIDARRAAGRAAGASPSSAKYEMAANHGARPCLCMPAACNLRNIFQTLTRRDAVGGCQEARAVMHSCFAFLPACMLASQAY